MANKSTRRQFVGGTAVTGAALIGTLGFDRRTGAQDLSASITQTASFRLNLERRDEGVAFLTELCAAVEELEPGVLTYVAHESQADPGVVVFYEVYENQEVLAAHSQQPHLGKMRQAFGQGIFLPLSATVPLEIFRLQRLAGFSR